MMTRTIVNALTVDVEDWFQVSALAGSIAHEDWPRMESRVERNTERLLALFDSAGVRGTFFVLGWIAERYPGLVRTIAAAGHEVASHGYSHRLIYEQTQADFREETRRGKAILEDQIQRPVLGYRAASYSVTRASMWALDEIAEAGFTWDSSIFPVHHDRYGIAGFERWPHRLRTPAGFDLVEFPLTTWRVAGIDLPMAGGGYFRLYPYWLTRAGLTSVNHRDRKPCIFYLHPWEVDPAQPRVKTSALSRFRHYNNLHRCADRLERLLRDFAFAPVGEVLAHAHLEKSPTPGDVAHA